MADLAQPPRKTVRDFMALPEGTRAELIRGELTILTPAPFVPHQIAVQNLLVALTLWARPRKAGQVLVAPMDVHLPSGDILEPDVLFVATSRLDIVKKWVYGVPDLVVEVLSPSKRSRDRRLKRGVYAENEVPEYWIVDPDEHAIDVLRLDGRAYALAAGLEPADTLTSPLLRGFSMPVADVFEP